MGGDGDGGGKGVGDRGEDFLETVVTCEGNVTDPDLPTRLAQLVNRLKHMTQSG